MKISSDFFKHSVCDTEARLKYVSEYSLANLRVLVILHRYVAAAIQRSLVVAIRRQAEDGYFGVRADAKDQQHGIVALAQPVRGDPLRAALRPFDALHEG